MISPNTLILAQKVSELISENSSIEVNRSCRPKNDSLVSIADQIVILLDHLIPLAAQLRLINSLDKNFRISNTTYLSFLKENLMDTYVSHKKNRLFAKKAIKIKEFLALYPQDYSAQFHSLKLSGRYEVTLKDYVFFIENYYSKESETFFAAKEIKHYPTTIKVMVQNPEDNGETFVQQIIEEPADTFADVVSDVSKSRKHINVVPEIKKKEKISSGNISKMGNFTVYKTLEDRKVLQNAEGYYKIGLMPNCTQEHVPELWEIVTDRNDFPEEINSIDFRLGKYNHRTQGFDEDYVFFIDIEFVQFADPNTYGLVDGLLFVCGTAYQRGAKGYMLYRYYKGKIYFIENLVLPKTSATLLRTNNTWYDDNISAEFSVFFRERLEEKIRRKTN